MPYIEHDGKRLLYLHVPKTGGTSIERWMESVAPLRLHAIGKPHPMRVTPQHLRLSDIEMLLGEGYFDYICMTVRNPFTRLESEYRMQVALAETGLWQRAPKFSFWLETALGQLASDPHALDNHLRPQWEFLGEDLGGNRVEIFPLEEGLSKPLAAMAAQLGLPAPETAAHALKTAPAPIKWRKPDILRVRRAYAEDFTEFGYDNSAPPKRKGQVSRKKDAQ